MNRFLRIPLVAALFAANSAFAAGYEKAIMFGGRTAGVAGIASPYIQGPQSLYFNPAGLVSEKIGMGVDANLTGLQSQFKGPIDNTGGASESDKKLLTPFGVFYGITTDEKMGFGFGVYSSAGSQAKFENVKVGNVEGNSAETDLTVIEVAGGAAYRVMPGLKVGLAYRVLMTDGSFSFIQRNPAAPTNAIINAQVKDLKGQDYLSYKIGAQYDINENTKVGLTYRGQTDLVLKGKFGGQVNTPATDQAIDENDATVKTTLPQAVTLGASHKYGTAWTSYLEYVWTQYSRVEHVTLDGTLSRSGGTVIAADAPDLEQHWKDQHQVKIAGEYAGLMMPVRLGYIWTSQVTDDDFARASFTAPGNAHTFTLGTGYAINEKISVDGGFDYTTVKGKGNGSEAGVTTGDIRQGEHETIAYALHLGMSYSF